MNRKGANEQGAVLVTFAVMLMVLLGFTALAYEVGYWYLVRSELSKAADSAALSAAANISNPYVAPEVIAEDFGYENFSPGFLGTPLSGSEAVIFTGTREPFNRVRVVGQVSAQATLSRLFGMDVTAISSEGVAQKKEVEIMVVLDRSGSMSGTPMTNLKSAARSFVDFFEDTQDTDRMGLVSFATSVTVNRPMGTNYVTAMNTAITNLQAVGATNIEDAVTRSGAQFADQSGIPGDQRVEQFMVFFSDGNPTAFRGTFRHNNIVHDAVGVVTSNCRPNETPVVHTQLGNHSVETWLSIDPRDTGDGLRTAATPLTSCGYTSGWWWNQTFTRYLNTKWEIFEERPIPRPNASPYPAAQCAKWSSPYDDNQPDSNYFSRMARHICNVARTKSLDNIQVLKDRNIKIYAIGLGNVDEGFLEAISSGPSFTYYTPNSSDLEAIFQEVARQIKLRLIQ
ncbi:vWA domain-containing protein [Desulfonatronum lacustre]|uniref:vWA domain-containing protein n=1 Tax=Desulfonatronum lacustre TaxID=66849 RepID=UPI00048C449E|nr:vWA domain-containing protein [Desulfonatronum lacustre]